jgi:hypothetical protein
MILRPATINDEIRERVVPKARLLLVGEVPFIERRRHSNLDQPTPELIAMHQGRLVKGQVGSAETDGQLSRVAVSKSGASRHSASVDRYEVTDGWR